MLKPDENLMGLNIDFKLSDRERAIMVSAVHQEWFNILQRLMEEEIRKLNVHHMNTPEDNERAILASFRLAKGAAMFYSGFISRLNEEVVQEQFNAAKTGTIEHPENSVADNFEQ